MMRWALAAMFGLVLIAGCGALATERLIGTWIGKPDLSGSPLAALAGNATDIKLTLNRDGTANTQGQSSTWRVVTSDDKTTTVETSSVDPNTKAKVSFEWKITWIDADHFTTHHPLFPQIKVNFERKK